MLVVELGIHDAFDYWQMAPEFYGAWELRDDDLQGPTRG